MGSESNKRTGIERGGDTGTPYADQVEIVGIDISADDLISAYKGTKREKFVSEVIRGIVQIQRTKDGCAPQWLVDAMMANPANPPPITIIDLNLDSEGVNHSVVLAGRHRTMSRRAEYAVRAAEGVPRSKLRQLSSINYAPPAIGTYAAVVTYRVVENVHERRSVSSRAEDVADLRASGRSVDSLTHEGEVATVEEVEFLLALHECDDEIKGAVNAGKVLLSDAPLLAKKTAAEQAIWLARKLAGSNSRAKNAAAPARAKTMRSAHIAAVGDEIARMQSTFTAAQVSALCKRFAGDADALSGPGLDRIAGIVESAKVAASANGAGNLEGM